MKKTAIAMFISVAAALCASVFAAVIETDASTIRSDYAKNPDKAQQKYLQNLVKLKIKVMRSKDQTVTGYSGEEFVIATFNNRYALAAKNLNPGDEFFAICQVVLTGSGLGHCEVSP